ncbi:glycoside hydrolase family 10 protein [Limnoraphis robusta]|uniref:Family 10 glycosylhydrolase n=1 Tax=Limnoraphis robusta CCNP1315 TaxID=3110306 RepID=A0ABU5TYG4_9CYAN|nr:family 10 glycosylhydrolase [Limnoraphis robusta]MEA5519929.1 family 10 glycosylhydrolase [Limnoraphis robusta CCNP1315]MEA5545169.1 family 10 glycosylhydrolase [Limnoraphis robusta CCNP1324]
MEVRGVWITSTDSKVLYSRQTIAEAMQFLAETGFNVVFPVVWNKGVTLYRSQMMSQQFGVEIDFYVSRGQGRDPLRELIEEAHQVGLKVIPWFEYGFACSYQQNGGRILSKKPHWAALNAQGNLLVKNGFEWMNGFDTEVQNFIIDLILEVVKNYDVDGIQGDDRMPAMPSEGGYDTKTVERYIQEYGRQPPLYHKDEQWLQWRADILTGFLARLYREVKAIKPHVLVSMAPSPYRWGLNEYLQDYIAWIDQNLLDLIHPQLYRRNFWSYKGLVDQLVDTQFRNGQILKLSPGILLKIGSYRITEDELLKSIEYNRFRGIKGEVFFFYEGLRENNNALGNALRKGPYRTPAPRW